MQDGTKKMPLIDTNISNQISIMSSSVGVVTLWALGEGNWVWGYMPLYAYEFGKAQIWRVISFANNQLMIKNEAK